MNKTDPIPEMAVTAGLRYTHQFHEGKDRGHCESLVTARRLKGQFQQCRLTLVLS